MTRVCVLPITSNSVSTVAAPSHPPRCSAHICNGWYAPQADASVGRGRAGRAQACVHLCALGHRSINSYKAMYVSLRVNPGARHKLYEKILEAAKMREDELMSDTWTVDTIYFRLKNSVQRDNYGDF